MSMSTAINIYLNQIYMTGGIPFSVTLPKTPASINAERMTADEIHAKIQEGYDDIEKGDTMKAAEAFAEFKEKKND